MSFIDSIQSLGFLSTQLVVVFAIIYILAERIRVLVLRLISAFARNGESARRASGWKSTGHNIWGYDRF